MKLYRFLICAAVASFFCVACDKDDEVADYGYLSGRMVFKKDIPFFVEYGYSQTMEVGGVYHPDASKTASGGYADTLGYCFQNPFTGKKDTVKFFTDPVGKDVRYEFKVDVDTLGTFDLIAYAFAPEYYASSCYSTFCVVKPGFGAGASLRKFDTGGEKAVIGSKEYFVTDIDGVRWMRQNLAEESAGDPYCSCATMTDIFGMYYTWEEAQTICPDGWELPSGADFDALIDKFGGVGALMADVYFNGEKASNKMWTYWPSVGSLTDVSHLSLIPTGYAVKTGDTFDYFDVNVRSVLWTKDEADAEKGMARYIYEDQNVLFSGAFGKTGFAAPVRCIKK